MLAYDLKKRFQWLAYIGLNRSDSYRLIFGSIVCSLCSKKETLQVFLMVITIALDKIENNAFL